jgi:hypothetical protein
MVILVVIVERPKVLLVELNDRNFDGLRDVNENGVQLGGVRVLHLPFLFVVNIHLFLR